MNNDEQQQQQEQSDTTAIIPVCTWRGRMAGMNNDEQQQQQEQSDTTAIIPVCTCDIRCGGCTCGAMERERAAQERAAQAGRLECLLPGDGERMVAEIPPDVIFDADKTTDCLQKIGEPPEFCVPTLEAFNALQERVAALEARQATLEARPVTTPLHCHAKYIYTYQLDDRAIVFGADTLDELFAMLRAKGVSLNVNGLER